MAVAQVAAGHRAGRGSPLDALAVQPSPGTGAARQVVVVSGARGGQGTTTVAAALALFASGARQSILVASEPETAARVLGVAVPAERCVEVTSRLRLASILPAAGDDTVVIDGGHLGHGVVAPAGASHWVVLRGPCYLALASLLEAPVRPDGIILVAETGRSLTAIDASDITGLPVVATVTASPAVARAIDAGILPARISRLPELAQLRSLVPPTPAAPHPVPAQPHAATRQR